MCTQLLVSRPDEENITSYLQLIEKCLTHEVRTSLELPRKVAPSLSESEPLFLMWPAGPWLAPACFSSLHLTSLGFSGCPELSFLESLYNVPSLVNNSPPPPPCSCHWPLILDQVSRASCTSPLPRSSVMIACVSSPRLNCKLHMHRSPLHPNMAWHRAGSRSIFEQINGRQI